MGCFPAYQANRLTRPRRGLRERWGVNLLEPSHGRAARAWRLPGQIWPLVLDSLRVR
jgi:hypothetical protein